MKTNDKNPRSFKIEIIGTSVVIAVLLLHYFLSQHAHGEANLNEHLVLGILLECIVMLIAIRFEGQSIAANTDVLIKNISNDDSTYIPQVLDNAKRSNNPIFINTTKETVKTYKETLKPSNKELGGMTVKGRYFAYKSYIYFWRELIRYQQEANLKGFVRIVHSINNKLWVSSYLTEYSDELFQLQTKFINNGGVIKRVFVGKSLKPDAKHEEIMNFMEGLGIKVEYLCTQNPIVDYDFIWASVGKTENLVKWFYDENGCLVKSRQIDHVDPQTEEVWLNRVENKSFWNKNRNKIRLPKRNIKKP